MLRLYVVYLLISYLYGTCGWGLPVKDVFTGRGFSLKGGTVLYAEKNVYLRPKVYITSAESSFITVLI